MNPFRPQRLNLGSRGIAKVFGECEAMMLETLWSRPAASVRDVQSALRRKGHQLSFNATMTILNRLVEKGVVRKQKKNGIFAYSPHAARAAFLGKLQRDILRMVIADRELFSTAAFVDAMDDLSSKDRAALKKILDRGSV